MAFGRYFFGTLGNEADIIISSFHWNKLMQSRGVRRPSFCLSVNFYTKIAILLPQTWLDCYQSCTRWSPHGPASRVCSRSRSRSKVTWHGHFHDYTKIASSTTNVRIATKLVHDGPQHSPHPGCAQGQDQGQRSRDTGTSVMSRNVYYTVPSDVLSLHAFTLRSTDTLSFQYKCQTARCNVCLHHGMSYSVIDGLVIQYYLVPCRLSGDPKKYDLEWPWRVIWR